MLVTEYVAFSGRSAGPYILYILFKVYSDSLANKPSSIYFPSFTYCGGDRGKGKVRNMYKVILLSFVLISVFIPKIHSDLSIFHG